MSYATLSDLVQFRPLSATVTFDPYKDREHSRFSASWSSTVRDLARELTALRAERVVMELDMFETDFRLDGLPRANARPASPGVVLYMDTPHGPLRYAVDTYAHWQENVRAIALALEALRAVDRYGVTRKGEQYAGWRALPQTTALNYERRGLELIAKYGGVKEAMRATHPDVGGDEEDFKAVQAVAAGRS